MSNSDARKVVDAYRKAWDKGHWTKARELLHDDLSFAGPIDTFDNADDYLAAIQGLSQIKKGTKTHKVFVDGNDVAVFYDLLVVLPVGSAPVAEWFRVSRGKIRQIQVIFDARPFAPPG